MNVDTLTTWLNNIRSGTIRDTFTGAELMGVLELAIKQLKAPHRPVIGDKLRRRPDEEERTIMSLDDYGVVYQLDDGTYTRDGEFTLLTPREAPDESPLTKALNETTADLTMQLNASLDDARTWRARAIAAETKLEKVIIHAADEPNPQRWENAVRSMVTFLVGPAGKFEIKDVVETVRVLAGCNHNGDRFNGAARLGFLTLEGDIVVKGLGLGAIVLERDAIERELQSAKERIDALGIDLADERKHRNNVVEQLNKMIGERDLADKFHKVAVTERDHERNTVNDLILKLDAAVKEANAAKGQIALNRRQTEKVLADNLAHLDDIARFRAEIGKLARDRDHWKDNHDNQVAIKAAVLDRPDLGDRAQKVQELARESNYWKAEASRLAEGIHALCPPAGVIVGTTPDILRGLLERIKNWCRHDARTLPLMDTLGRVIVSPESAVTPSNALDVDGVPHAERTRCYDHAARALKNILDGKAPTDPANWRTTPAAPLYVVLETVALMVQELTLLKAQPLVPVSNPEGPGYWEEFCCPKCGSHTFGSNSNDDDTLTRYCTGNETWGCSFKAHQSQDSTCFKRFRPAGPATAGMATVGARRSPIFIDGQPKWISFDERKPAVGQEVFVARLAKTLSGTYQLDPAPHINCNGMRYWLRSEHLDGWQPLVRPTAPVPKDAGGDKDDPSAHCG